MKRMRKSSLISWKRRAAVVLALAMAAAPVESAAAAVPVTTDETAYVLLDYDGDVKDISIVKACDLNGNSQITDYGIYSSVSNMSTEDVPLLREDGITWNVTGLNGKKFYYEVKPENQLLDTPWKVEVSYRLNGVPTAGEKLAGAAGLVAIDVHVIPNEAADEYFQDNFLLMAGMVSDTEEDLSFLAEGAQFQTIGSYQAALYMALPKKEETFRFEIGTESFENTGVFITMMPVTLSQMDDLVEMREHKENLEDAGNAMDDIMDDMLEMMGDMAKDTDSTAQGLEQLDQAREEVHSYRDNMDASLEEIKASISRLEATMTDFAAIAGDSKLPAAVRTMGRGLEDISSAVSSIMGKMETMADALEEIQDNVGKLRQITDSNQKVQMAEKLKQQLAELEQQMGALGESGELEQLAGQIQGWLDMMENAGLIPEGTIPSLQTPSEIDMPILDLDELEAYSDLMEEMAGSMVYETKRMTSAISKIADKGEDLVDGIDTMTDGIFDTADEIDSILKITSDTMVDAAGLLGSMRNTIEIADQMLDACDKDLNEGTHRTLTGLTSMLRQLTKTLNKSEDLKKNKNIISDVIRDEWHRLDDEFELLDIDTKAEKISFTSVRNEEPRSLQIIMRTEEISLDDGEDVQTQMAVQTEPVTFWERIAAIFQAIKDFLQRLFA